MGKASYTYVPILWPPWNVTVQTAAALWKTETKGIWCDTGSFPDWHRWVSKHSIIKLTLATGVFTTITDEPAEVPDVGSGGYTTGHISSRDPSYKNTDGTYNSFIMDAPRYGPDYNIPAKYRYYFKAEFRLRFEDGNAWETKYRLGFSWDDDANQATAGAGYFTIISPPAPVP